MYLYNIHSNVPYLSTYIFFIDNSSKSHPTNTKFRHFFSCIHREPMKYMDGNLTENFWACKLPGIWQVHYPILKWVGYRYLSHRILDSFSLILKWKIIRLKPVLLAPRFRRIFIVIFIDNWLQYITMHDFLVWSRLQNLFQSHRTRNNTEKWIPPLPLSFLTDFCHW